MIEDDPNERAFYSYANATPTDTTIKAQGDHLVVLFEPDQPAWARNETMEAIQSASYGISQRGKYGFSLSEEEIARNLDPDHPRSYVRRSDKGDHKPAKFLEKVCQIKVVL